MATVPADIQEAIKKLAEVNKLPVKSLFDRLVEIIKTDETIKTMEKEEFKIRFAYAKLYMEFSGGKSTDCYIMPLMTARTRTIVLKGENSTVGNVSCLLQKIEKDETGNPNGISETFYGAGTLWRDAAKNSESLEVGKVYRTSLQMKDNKWGITISSDRAGFVPAPDIKMPSLKDFYEKEIKPRYSRIALAERDLFISENDTDIRIIEVTVLKGEVGEKDGREFGYYTVMDESSIGAARPNEMIFIHPKDVLYTTGTIAIMGGKVTLNEKKEVRWDNQFTLPGHIVIPRSIIVKPVTAKQGTVDIDLGAEMKIEKKGEKKEEPKSDEINFDIST